MKSINLLPIIADNESAHVAKQELSPLEVSHLTVYIVDVCRPRTPVRQESEFITRFSWYLQKVNTSSSLPKEV